MKCIDMQLPWCFAAEQFINKIYGYFVPSNRLWRLIFLLEVLN